MGRRRRGLLEHAQALTHFLVSDGIEAHLVSPPFPNEQYVVEVNELRKRKIKFKNSTIVFWCLGIEILLMPFFKLLGCSIVFVLHEPGGLRQKVKKSDGLAYSIIAGLIEFIAKIFADEIGTPNKVNAKKYGHVFLPLLFREVPGVHEKERERNVAAYLGRQDKRRALLEFREISIHGVSTAFFPSATQDSEDQKMELLSRAICVVTAYTVPYNQTGVVPDSFRAGCPVIISDLDPDARQIEEFGAGVVVPSRNLSKNMLQDAIMLIKTNQKQYCNSAIRYYQRFHGLRSYRVHWKPLLLGP